MLIALATIGPRFEIPAARTTMRARRRVALTMLKFFMDQFLNEKAGEFPARA
jgi:hypothetical protein